MTKDFITVTPDSGSGSDEVSVTAPPNVSYSPRETTLTIGASGLSRAIDIAQGGLLLPCIQDSNDPTIFMGVIGQVNFSSVENRLTYITQVNTGSRFKVCLLSSYDNIQLLSSMGYKLLFQIGSGSQTEMIRQGGGSGFNGTDAFISPFYITASSNTIINLYVFKQGETSQPVQFLTISIQAQ